MSNVELTLAAENVGYHGLRTDLRQITLSQAVLLHQIAQHLMSRCVRNRIMRAIVSRNQVAHLRGQSGDRPPTTTEVSGPPRA
ncbi:hypothetical protein D3C85_1615530 [compost metagenome]